MMRRKKANLYESHFRVIGLEPGGKRFFIALFLCFHEFFFFWEKKANTDDD